MSQATSAASSPAPALAAAPTRADLVHGSHRSLGFAFALAASLCYTLMSVGVYLGTETVAAGQLLFFRGALAATLLFPLARAELTRASAPTLRKLALIALTGGLAIGAAFLNLQLISVGTARSFGSLGLIFTLVVAYFALGERVSWRALMGILLVIAAFGLLVSDDLIRPPALSIALGVFGALMISATATTVRAIARHVAPPVVVWAMAVSMVVVGFFMPGEWTLGGGAVTLIGVVAVAGAAGQMLSVLAYRHLEAGIAATIERTDLVWAVVLVALIESSLPHPLEIAAYTLVMAGVIVLQPGLRLRRRRHVSVPLDPTRPPERLDEMGRARLGHAVEQAESETSCEFKLHLDMATDTERRGALELFECLGVERTELGSGVLVCVTDSTNTLDVVYDRGIGGKVSTRRLREWTGQLAREVDRHGAVGGLAGGLPELARALGNAMPRASDDRNELTDELSLVIE